MHFNFLVLSSELISNSKHPNPIPATNLTYRVDNCGRNCVLLRPESTQD